MEIKRIEPEVKIRQPRTVILTNLNYTITQYRLFMMAINSLQLFYEKCITFNIKPEDAVFDEFKIEKKDGYMIIEVDISDMIHRYKEDNIAYNLRKLTSANFGIKIPDGPRHWVFTCLYSEMEDYKLKFQIWDKVRDMFFDITRNYFTYDLNTAMSIGSIYTLRMYWLIMSFLAKGKFSLKMSTLRDMLNCDKKYLSYRRFREKVLEEVRKELQEHSTHWFTYQEVGRDDGEDPEKIEFYVFKKLTYQERQRETAVKNSIINYFVKEYKMPYNEVEKEMLAIRFEDLTRMNQRIKDIQIKLKDPKNNIKDPVAYAQSAVRSLFDDMKYPMELEEEDLKASQISVYDRRYFDY